MLKTYNSKYICEKLRACEKEVITLTNDISNKILSTRLRKSAVLIFLFFFCSLYSQEGIDTASLIGVRDNAQIYSPDPSFTKQLISQVKIDYEISSSGQAFLFKSKDKYSKKELVRISAKAGLQNLANSENLIRFQAAKNNI